MDGDEGERNGQEGSSARPLADGRMEDDRDEEGAQEDLDARSPPRYRRLGRRRRHDLVVVRDEDDDRRDDRPHNLGDPVADHVIERQAAIEKHRKGHDRVEVPSRDLAEGIEADQESETEAERDRRRFPLRP